jgi:hypothetical protein
VDVDLRVDAGLEDSYLGKVSGIVFARRRCVPSEGVTWGGGLTPRRFA